MRVRRWRVAALVSGRALLRQGLAGLLMLGIAAPSTAQPSPTWADLAPLFQQRCTVCHSGPNAAVGLALDSLEGLRKGSSRGPVVQAGQPAGSELVKRLKGLSVPRMPLTGPPWLDQADVARVEAWISAGLPAGQSVAAAAPVAAAPAVTQPAPGQPVTWVHVAPIFATRCAKCHAPQGLMGPAPEGYLLNSLEGVLAAADRVRVVPGRPEASELWRRIRGHAQPRMPFDGPPWLDEAQIGLIERWIAEGARDASGQLAPMPAGARLRLRGVLSADGTLDGLALPAGGRRDRGPRPGGRVELRGNLRADGSIEVERLRGR